MAGRTPEEWGNHFRLVRPKIEAFTEVLERLIVELLDVRRVEVAQIEARTKEIDSFIGKIQRKNEKYSDPLVEITDQSGIRVIAYYPADAAEIGTMIEEEFDIDWNNSVRPGLEADPQRFGYRSDHYVVSLSTARRELAEWASHRNRTAEIQVRTVMQHAWAAVDHKIRYKREDLPQALQRRLFRLSAMLEIADEQFSLIRRESVEVVEAYERSLTGGDYDLGLDVLSLRGFLEMSNFLSDWTNEALQSGYESSAKTELILDDSESYVETEDWSMLMDVLRDLDVDSIDAVQRELKGAGRWGGLALEQIKLHSEKAGLTPIAVPKDILAFLFLYGAQNMAAVDRTPYFDQIKRGIKAAIREVKEAS